MSGRGIYPRSLEVREKQRYSMIGRHSGENNPNYKDGRSKVFLNCEEFNCD